MGGLLRGMARTAVVAGTATAVSNNVSRRQAQRYAEKDQQAYAQQQQAYVQQPQQQQVYQSDTDVDAQLDQLAQLGQLRDQGILTQAEFEAKKRQILGL